MSRRWVDAGHRVSVICGIPNHPNGVLYPGYAKKALHAEVLNGIHVYRTWVYVTPNAGRVKRSMNFLSFAISSVVTAERIKNADVVIATSPQFLTGIAGKLVAWSRRLPFVLEIRDLWPASIRAVGIRFPSLLYNILDWLERRLYDTTRHFVIVSEGFRKHLELRGVPSSAITTITNGVNTVLFHPPNGNVRRYFVGALRNKCIVSYIGTIGMAHGLETVLHAARMLQDQENLHFVFIGEGARKAELITRSKDMLNVTFLERQSREQIAEILRETDISLVVLRNDPLFSEVIPSKIFEIMGCAKPVILAVPGEARRILEEASGGIAIEPENAQQLRDAILKLYHEPDLRSRYGSQGHAHVVQYYNMDSLSAKYLRILSDIGSSGHIP